MPTPNNSKEVQTFGSDPSAGERPATYETIPEAVIEAAAKAGQKLAVHWGHQPWSDSWAEQVARTTLEAALPHLSDYRGLLQGREAAHTAWEEARYEVWELLQERDELREALRMIRDDEGRVCECYELCSHRACKSSYTAWAIADAALSGASQEEE